MNQKTIITIGRQFGSGGREIGARLAKELGFAFYDKELISIAAKDSGMSEAIFENNDEKATNSFLYSIATGMYLMGNRIAPAGDIPLNDKLYFIQADVIRSIAERGSAVIVGRCGDYVLRENKNCLNVFIHAPLEDRVKRATTEYDIKAKNIEDYILKTDKKRANYYNYYTGQKWSKAENYHISLDSSKLGADGCVRLLKQAVLLHE